MSSVTYRYEQNYSFLKKNIKHTIKEQVIDGTKGLTVMYLHKEGDKFFKLYAKEEAKDKFKIQMKEGEKVTESEMTEKELLKVLKTHKLQTIIDYITNERGTYKGKKVQPAKIMVGGY
jgi:hypothetical protein